MTVQVSKLLNILKQVSGGYENTCWARNAKTKKRNDEEGGRNDGTQNFFLIHKRNREDKNLIKN